VASASLRERVLRVAGRCLRVPPAAWLARGWFRRRTAIVFLHGVWERGSPRQALFGGLYVDQLDALVRSMAGFFDFVDLDGLLADADGDGRPRVHLTFDDGLDLVASGAADVLDAHGVRATVFVNTACATNGHLMWQHGFAAIRRERGDERYLAALNRLQERTGQAARVASPDRQTAATRHWPMARKDEWAAEIWRACDMPPVAEFLAAHRPYLDWDALRDWTRRGHGVGSHTHSHPFVSRLSDAEIATEVLEPATELRRRLRLASVSFAYPFGDRAQPAAEDRIARAGVYSCLLGTGRLSARGEPIHALDRVEVEDGAELELFARPVVQALRGRARPPLVSPEWRR
jgi:peptidoglycan/xylan/chitin deacetylase (PgdA/CDA1 family)